MVRTISNELGVLSPKDKHPDEISKNPSFRKIWLELQHKSDDI